MSKRLEWRAISTNAHEGKATDTKVFYQCIRVTSSWFAVEDKTAIGGERKSIGIFSHPDDAKNKCNQYYNSIKTIKSKNGATII